MGLTERHWFEDEEPELTENQLEDILWENNKIFERGYQKGFSDGKSAILREQEPVKPERVLGVLPDWYCCGVCGANMLDTGDGYRPKYCPQCGRKVKWDE